MAAEQRKPPRNIGLYLRRALGGRAGWRGFAAQIAFVAFVAWLGHEIYSNAQENLQAQRIATGFEFLGNTAGFATSQSLIPYNESDTYTRVLIVGLLNTLLVSVLGIIFATILGFVVGLARLSPNWLVARLAGGYVELIRNLPLLFQILFWYLAVLATLPSPRQSVSIFGTMFINNRGVIVPRPLAEAGFDGFLFASVAALLIAIAMAVYARRRLYATGQRLRVWPYVLGVLLGFPLVAVMVFGTPVSFEMPQLRGFNFAGGLRLIPEFVALLIALSTYTAAFIAEIVRAGVLAIHKGQVEAGASLGLSRGAVTRLIVVPQALRVILPPLTNQYLNLTKNSSLAVAIGYPDLVSVFAGTSLSQTGQAIEIIAITMGIYLLLSLITSVIMNFYNWRISRSLAR